MFIITGTGGAAALGLPVWAGIVVFISAGLAVSISRLPALSDIPVMMHSLVCAAAYVAPNNAGGAKILSLSIVDNASINVCLPILVGIGFDILAAILAGAFMVGDSKSIIDAYLLPMIRWSLVVFPEDKRNYPTVYAHHDRMRKGASVEKVLHDEGTW